MDCLTKKEGLLTDSEFADLFIRMKDGDLEARRILIERNIGLVGACIKKFIGVYDYDDIQQEGAIGLINEVDTYNIENGVKFSTYATTCIINNIKIGSFHQSKTFRVSKDLYEKYNIYTRTVKKLQQKLFRNPVTNEIFEEMQKVVTKRNKIRKNKLKLDIKTVEMLPYLFDETVSFNKEVNNDSHSKCEFQDLYPSKESNFADDIIQKNFVETLIEQANLSDKYKETIKMRYGFYGRDYTLKEVAEVFGVNYQTISNW